MDDAAGHGNFVTLIEGMQLFEVELAAAELRFDFVAAGVGKPVDVKKVAGKEIGVHTGFGLFAVMVEGSDGFGLGLVRGNKRGEKAERNGDGGGVDRTVAGWLHERNILKTWLRGLDEEREKVVRVKERRRLHFGTVGGKDEVVENLGRKGGTGVPRVVRHGYFSYVAVTGLISARVKKTANEWSGAVENEGVNRANFRRCAYKTRERMDLYVTTLICVR
jgi:hypothetical protein